MKLLVSAVRVAIAMLAALSVSSVVYASTITGSNERTDVRAAVASAGVQDSATYVSSFLLTVTGGTGSGWFEPFATVSNTWQGSENSRASITIDCGVGCGGSLFSDFSTSPTKTWFASGSPLPFTYGQSMLVRLSITAFDCCAVAVASEAVINSFAQFDTATQRPFAGPAVFSVQPISATPEPNSAWFVIGGLSLSYVFFRGRLRKRSKRSTP